MDEIALPDEHAEPGPPEVPAPPAAPVADVPHRTAIDCATGECVTRPLTDDELAVIAAQQEVTAASRRDAEALMAVSAAAREADIALVREAAVKDPTAAAILRLLGISTTAVL